MLPFGLCSLLMTSQAGWWTQTTSATLLLTIKLNAHILIMFNFWWMARLVNGLELHPPPLCSQKNEMLLFWITLNFWWLAGLSDGLKPHPPSLSRQKKWNAHFWITFNFWWLAGLVDGLKPHPPPVSSQKKEILVFVLRWTSDDQPGWLMDSNPICRPSPANKKKCSYFDYVQLLMTGRAGQWTRTPSATPLQQKKGNAHILIMFNFWWSAGLLYGLKPIFHLSPAKKWNGYFWITFNF